MGAKRLSTEYLNLNITSFINVGLHNGPVRPDLPPVDLLYSQLGAMPSRQAKTYAYLDSGRWPDLWNLRVREKSWKRKKVAGGKGQKRKGTSIFQRQKTIHYTGLSLFLRYFLFLVKVEQKKRGAEKETCDYHKTPLIYQTEYSKFLLKTKKREYH